MSTDIHVFVESRADWSYWFCDARFDYVPGNYTLFGLLAGVRGLEEPVYDPRGLPYCPSDVLLDEYKKDDYHTPSWLTPDELKEVLRAYRDYGAYKVPVGIRAIQKYAKALEKSGRPVRVVFWFDG